jgi:hypothetical protein
MTIVSDKNVETALTYLSADPHPIALARKDVTDAENKCKELFASLYLASSCGSVAAREADVNSNPAYTAAKSEEAQAIFDLERHRARSRAADMLIECWRTEQSNIRAAERFR